jgi:Na+/H+-dicarboxylate symporter
MLHVAIGLGLVLGIGTGLLAAAGSGLAATLAMASEPLGTAFISAIRMVIVPLVMAVIFTGVANLGDPRKLGRLGGTTLAVFWATVVPAILIGMGVMHLAVAWGPEVAVPDAAAREAPTLPGMVDFLVGLIPSNPFAAAADGALLQLIVFTALLGAAAGTLDEDRRRRLVDFAEAVGDALIRLVWWILWTAPLGIFGLAAPVTARLGFDLIQSLAVFIVAVIVALGIYIAVVYLPLLKLVGGIGPARFLGGTFGAASIAFSTTSTAAALPVTLEEAKRKLGVSETVADLVLPLGASMYRAGSALFQGAAVVFLADLFAVPFPPAAVGGAVLATFMVSLTVAPVPSSGVMTLAPALDTVGIPLSGLSILLGVDRIPDMFRSTTNLLGQITTAVVVDAWAGERDGHAPEGGQGT